MTQDYKHPITPPPELVAAWCREADDNEPMFPQVAAKAAQWGADQELEACCEWASQFNYDDYRYQDELRSLRRPKPPSLKEKALEEVGAFEGMGTCNIDIIRRALEQLDD